MNAFSPLIGIDNQQFSLLRKILSKHLGNLLHPKVFAFGSRVSGDPRKNSDLDLLVETAEPLAAHQLIALQHDLEESNLLFRVDLILPDRISDEIRSNIDQLKKIDIPLK